MPTEKTGKGSLTCILRIAVPSPLFRLFDYLPPKDFSAAETALLLPGMRVRAPFGRSVRIGIISEIAEHSNFDISKLKEIHEVLDDTPLFPETIQKLIHFASNYYHCSLGEVFNFALPVWLRKGNKIVSENNQKLAPSKKRSKKSKKTAENHVENAQETHYASESQIDKTTLNTEQQFACDTICNSIGQFKTFLVDGITGSGKTEVYMQAIEKVLQQNKQALVLVPEIGLTPQMLERFQKRFPVPIALLHSSISEKKRFNAWNHAKEGLAPIVIGTRSASFVPLKNPGIFIIDEEHDNSFKQQDSFRYNARDLIILRGSLENCPVVLGTATPSLETLYNSQTGRFQHLRLSKRAGKAQPPLVQLLDIRHKKLDEGLSSQLIHEIKKNIESDGQVLLFLNRRGFAPVLMCFDCGAVFSCQHCDAKLTLHFRPKRLICHHCDVSIVAHDHCPSCHSLNLQPLGVGTERLESALTRLFPDHGIVRIDRDTTRRKGTLQQAVDKIKTGEAKILLGTQMIAKGHHFPNVTLVAILDIDSALFSSDFRSLERMGQLLTQVAGRAGRAERLGTCILQTCHPENPLLAILLDKGYSHFAEALLSERRACRLPPFSYHALIRTEAKSNERALGFLRDLKKAVQDLKPKPKKPNIQPRSDVQSKTEAQSKSDMESKLEILGPIPAQMERKAGFYRAQLLLQAKERSLLQQTLKKLVAIAESHPLGSKLKWNIDVDPTEII